MANLVSSTIPNLIQGASLQPDASRDPSQGDEQINGMSSLTEGLRKREGTECIKKVATSAFNDVYMHQILRDSGEKYLVVISKTSIKVFDLDGNEKTVNVATNAFNYLSTVSSSKTDIRAATIADYTFISNTKTSPALMTAEADKAPATARPTTHEALVWVKAGNYGQQYICNIHGKQVTVTTAVAPVIVSGSETIENRISTADIAERLMNAFYPGSINSGTGLITYPDYLIIEKPTVTQNTTATSTVTTTDGSGTGLKLNVVMNGSLITSLVVSGSGDHGTNYVIGDKIYVAKNILEGGTDTTAVHIATVKGVVPATPNTINGKTVSITRNKSVLHVTSGESITIAAQDARANADITCITSEVQVFTELPTIAPSGYQIKILGDPSNSFDNYHVEFVPRTGAGTFGEGSWQECVSPGEFYKIDKDTMPHLLVRVKDTDTNGNVQFHFGPADGSTFGGTDLPTWGERTCGDTDSAPNPSFIGFPIQDVFIYKNRLGFLADENIILSRAKAFFDFFPETVTTLLDSDPIDLQASNTKVSILRYAIPYQDELIIFSDQIQFRFNAAETILTPSTAVITVLTQFEVDINCRPLPVAGTIIFAQANGIWSSFREFSVKGAGSALVADASDLTSYVNSYIPSDVFKLTSNDTGNSWFALSSKTGFEDRVYVYKYFYRNTGSGAERAQSSWSYWELNGADKILQVLCVEETLYLLAQYGDDVWLEKMPVADRLSDVSPSPYPFLLDRKVSTTTDTPAAIRVSAGSYNNATKQTTWTLPFTIVKETQAWSGFNTTTDGAVYLGTASSGTSITAEGDWSTSPVYFGEVFDFTYRFTKFKLYKEIGGGKAPGNVERTQVRHAKLRYHQTNYFEIHVKAERRDTAVYKFDGTILRVRDSVLGNTLPATGYDRDNDRFFEGVFRIPINSKGENCVVEIHNKTIHPCKFSTCEWVGLITSQARSIQ